MILHFYVHFLCAFLNSFPGSKCCIISVCLQFGAALGTELGVLPCRTGQLLPSQGKTGNISTAVAHAQKKDAKLRILISKEAEDTEGRICLSWGLRKNNIFFFFWRPGLCICQVQPGFSSWGFNGWRLIPNGNIDRLSNNHLIIFFPCPYMHFFPEGSSDFSCLQESLFSLGLISEMCPSQVC